MVLIPHIKIGVSRLVSPEAGKIDILEKIKPKLEQKQDHFQLKKSIIPTVSAQSDYEGAKAYGAIDFNTGEVIASKNLSSRIPIASLTKIMTAIVALDLANLDEVFTVSALASSQVPTKVMLKEGEKYSLEQLLDSMLISSANDSAQVIKEGIDRKYGQAVFVNAMNAKAQILGLKNTHFTNAQGYDNADHFSSIEDLAILAHYAMEKYPSFVQIVGKDFLDLTHNFSDLRFYLNNWNGLLGVYPGVYGIKIGNTAEAGICTIVLSEREGKKILAVVLGAPGTVQRDLWASELLDLGFSKIAGLSSVNVTEQQLREKYASWKYFN